MKRVVCFSWTYVLFLATMYKRRYTFLTLYTHFVINLFYLSPKCICYALLSLLLIFLMFNIYYLHIEQVCSAHVSLNDFAYLLFTMKILDLGIHLQKVRTKFWESKYSFVKNIVWCCLRFVL